jgi:hypothetical protein
LEAVRYRSGENVASVPDGYLPRWQTRGSEQHPTLPTRPFLTNYEVTVAAGPI